MSFSDELDPRLNMSDHDRLQQLCTILIIDDSEPDRFTYRRYLSQSNLSSYTILESDCGEAALELWATHSPDVILLDYLLPDCDGLEFLAMLKQTGRTIPPVIMLTGQGNEQVAVAAMKQGVHDYLVKGTLTSEQMTRTIQRVVAQRRLEQRLARQQQQQQLMADIALRISQAFDLTTILETTVEGVRQLLECDRTFVYQFDADMMGHVVAESVAPEWITALGQAIEDTCFKENKAERYLEGYKTVISDISKADLTPCHIQLLERFQVKANMVVPILLDETIATEKSKLWGLLIAHQCSGPREWQISEQRIIGDLAVQVAIAIQKNTLILALAERADTLGTMNSQLLQITGQLEQRNKELDEFAYIASHDLKAPLRAIANLASWLQEDISDLIPDENQQQLDLMQKRVQRMNDFIEGLLQYSRAGRQGLDLSPVDTHALVREILEAQAVPEAFRIIVPDRMPTLHTHKILLEQVLANLIGNALKYHDRPDGTIIVAVSDQGDQVEFAIADDGPGIDPQYHQKIFGIFQTLASRDTVESSGIGLSIVKKIVEQQGGGITVRSTPGEGSTFSFTWPKVSQT